MRARRIKYLLVAAGLFWPTAVFSQGFWSGNDLYKYCAVAEGMPGKSTCKAFILGAVDVLAADHVICLPEGFIAGQVVDIVTNFLRDHPESRHFTAASEIGVALKGFHCKNSN